MSSRVAARSPLQPGEMLNWYQLKSILGRGGFAVTYLAHDTNLQLDVAIKEYLPAGICVRDLDNSVIPASPADTSMFVWGLDSFLKEARTLVRFNHPNIVRVIAVFEAFGTAYMVMQYERGQDLKRLLANLKTLDEPALKSLLLPVIDGLKQVHRQGFIHRDIKPSNIYVRDDNSPVLIDFGSARTARASASRQLTSLVSAGFTPFEQYDNSADHQQGPWTDIYALAAVAYYVISGTAPVDSALRASALLNDQPDPLQPISESGKGRYSQEFLHAVDWALNFRVEERPQSLEAWQTHLAGPGTGTFTSLEEQPTAILTIAEKPGEIAKDSAAMRSDNATFNVTTNSQPAESAFAFDHSFDLRDVLRRSTDPQQQRSATAARRFLPGKRFLWVLAALLPLALTVSWLYLNRQSAGRSPVISNNSIDTGGSGTPVAEGNPLDRSDSADATAQRQRETEAAQRAAQQAAQEASLREQRQREAEAAQRAAQQATREASLRERRQRETEAAQRATLREQQQREAAAAPLADSQQPITSEELQTAVSQFNALAQAIRTKRLSDLTALIEPDSTYRSIFDYWFRSMHEIDVSLTRIRAIRANGRIDAQIVINTLIRPDGSRVLPSQRYRKIPVFVERTAEGWSAIRFADAEN